MTHKHSRLSCIALCGSLFIVACTPPPVQPDAAHDAGNDTNVTTDVTTDNGSPDAHPDAAADTGTDVPMDRGVDVATDTPTDTGSDVFDGGMDASADVATDTSDDAMVDDVLDAEVDAGSDADTSDAGTPAPNPGLVSIAYGAATISSTMTTLVFQEPGNLVTNAGFETGNTDGWTAGEWAATVGDPVINGVFGTYSATSSYSASTITQRVDLVAAGYTAAQLDASPTFEVRQWYRGGGYNTADSYRLTVTLRDQFDAVLDTYDTGPITTNSTWALASHRFSGYPAGVRAVTFSTTGSDTEFWAGNYGSVIDQTSVVLDLVEMRISNDGTTWTGWLPFSAQVPWTLAGTGTQTVMVEFRNATTMAPLGSATDSVNVAP